MSQKTPLDTIHAAMLADLEDNQARMAFYSQLADCELFMLLEAETVGNKITPEILDLDPDTYALVFDSEERLSDFAKGTAPYAALPGRVIAGMLAGQNIGLGLNLGVAPSSILIPPEALDWLQQALDTQPDQSEDRIKALHPVGDAAVLIPALIQKLAGLGRVAILALAENATGGMTPLLGVVDAPQNDHAAIAGAAQEALVFAAQDGLQLDVVFLDSEDTRLAAFMNTGTQLVLPDPVPDSEIIPATPPGSDPDKPPNLR